MIHLAFPRWFYFGLVQGIWALPALHWLERVPAHAPDGLPAAPERNQTTYSTAPGSTLSSPSSSDSSVSWETALWSLVALALNAMTQRSVADNFPAQSSLSPARSSPFICMGDLVTAGVWLLWGRRAGIPVAALARLYQDGLGLSEAEERPPLLNGTPVIPLVFLAIGPAPQAIKLFSMRGVAWTQTWGAVYVAAYLVAISMRLLASRDRDLSKQALFQSPSWPDGFSTLIRWTRWIYRLAYAVQLAVWIYIIVRVVSPTLRDVYLSNSCTTTGQLCWGLLACVVLLAPVLMSYGLNVIAKQIACRTQRRLPSYSWLVPFGILELVVAAIFFHYVRPTTMIDWACSEGTLRKTRAWTVFVIEVCYCTAVLVGSTCAVLLLDLGCLWIGRRLSNRKWEPLNVTKSVTGEDRRPETPHAMGNPSHPSEHDQSAVPGGEGHDGNELDAPTAPTPEADDISRPLSDVDSHSIGRTSSADDPWGPDGLRQRLRLRRVVSAPAGPGMAFPRSATPQIEHVPDEAHALAADPNGPDSDVQLWLGRIVTTGAWGWSLKPRRVASIAFAFSGLVFGILWYRYVFNSDGTQLPRWTTVFG